MQGLPPAAAYAPLPSPDHCWATDHGSPGAWQTLDLPRRARPAPKVSVEGSLDGRLVGGEFGAVGIGFRECSRSFCWRELDQLREFVRRVAVIFVGDEDPTDQQGGVVGHVDPCHAVWRILAIWVRRGGSRR